MRISELALAEVHEILRSSPRGLTEAAVKERLTELGPNVLQAPPRFGWARKLLQQLTNFFTLLLLAAAGLCLVADRLDPGGGMFVLGIALLGVSLLNALMSFAQEWRAERAMAALERFLPHQVSVRRDGRDISVAAAELVPGDVLRVMEGDRVPADARVVLAEGLLVDNAPLTGESRAVMLSAEPDARPTLTPSNVLFAGCRVLRGSGDAVVFATGKRTEFGKIAALSSETKRELSTIQHEINHMVRVLTIIAMGMGVTFFVLGVLRGRPLMVNLVFMMGIVVANVPEGLLPTFTLALAMGSLRMARRNVLVKNLSAVEAVGAIHVVCTDKTGTLTHGELALARVATPYGDPSPRAEEILRAALLACQVRERDGALVGDPLDVAIARRVDDPMALASGIERVFPFDLARRRSAGVGRLGGGRMFAVKGAWEALRPHVGPHVSPTPDAASSTSTAPPLERVDVAVDALTAQGYRVIAVATRPLDELPPASTWDTLEHDLELLGFLCLDDGLRDGVPKAVHDCHQAGIDVVLITGDHPNTARAVAVRAGIVEATAPDSVTVVGSDLERMSGELLGRRLDEGVRVFARTSPEQKMKIVRALQSRNKVVAMTGDGVNDAPALKAADVGIAMGKGGTDVARESAQMILLDDNFASIVAGIEEGRTVFGNIKKFTNYVLVSNGPEILPYLLYVLFPIPLALTVIQILSIDLGTDIVPSMALGREPPDRDVMRRPPRSRDDGLLTSSLVVHSYLFLGLIEAAWSMMLFFLVLHRGGWRYGDPIMAADDLTYRAATGIALASILLMQIGNLIGRRSPSHSGLDSGIFRNPLMVAGIAIQIVFSWATLYLPPVSNVLGTAPVDLEVYALAWLGIPLVFGLDGLRKVVRARRDGVPPPAPLRSDP